MAIKGIWEIKFNALEPNERMKPSDTRRVIKNADTGGMLQAAKWAEDHCHDHEFVSGISLISTEHL